LIRSLRFSALILFGPIVGGAAGWLLTLDLRVRRVAWMRRDRCCLGALLYQLFSDRKRRGDGISLASNDEGCNGSKHQGHKSKDGMGIIPLVILVGLLVALSLPSK